MLNRRHVGLFLAVAPLAACADQAMTPAASARAAAAATPAATGSPAFMQQALQGGAFLMQTAALGQQRARAPGLREFSAFEVAEQQTVMQAMTALLGTQPPMPALRQDQQQLLAALQAANGPAFDRTLVQAQLTGHEEALRTYTNIAQNTAEPPGMRALAIMAIGHINEHIGVLQRGGGRARA